MSSLDLTGLVSDTDDFALNDASTAPTTPEGSASFSPILRPQTSSRDLVGSTITLSAADYSSQYPQVRNICCVGAGYVGGPTTAVIAFQNPHIRVTVVDKDKSRIRRWNSKHPPIYEPGLSEILRIARDGSRECTFARGDTGHAEATTTVLARQPNLFFNTDVARCIQEADIVLIAVNTPTKTRGAGAGSATDMTAFEAVTAVVAEHARPGAIIVEKSTVPCRTAQLVEDTLAHCRPGVHFDVLSNPEFLAAGTAINDLLAADRILIGSRPTPSGRRAADTLASVYASWIPQSRIITTNVFSSELAKLVANSMLAQRVSSINSIATICEATGADIDEISAAIGADPRIGNKFLRAGIGFGGSCFKKDVLSLVYLAETLNLPEVANYWRCVVSMNEYIRNRFAARVIKCLNNTLRGKKLALLGYAFKKNSNDTRESATLEIIRTLLEERPKEIAVFDPCCIPSTTEDEIERLLGSTHEGPVLKKNGGVVEVYANAYDACHWSDAVLITTEFDEFRYTEPGKSSKSAIPTYTRPQMAEDPRPFVQEPTESDLLALHKYLSSISRAQVDPLGRFNDSPSCASDCPDCLLEKAAGPSISNYGAGGEHQAKDYLDWAKVSHSMRNPKWVFDGRGLLDIRGMEKLGFRVETTGRQAGFASEHF
ncbi:hypothetical protein GE09DRAFT_618928 [Coniochaeta sp. 2T2.1]|nr:hypothetical protein GE09DRAFT_618928 [Coniochaeta sp. 2T2.1]